MKRRAFTLLEVVAALSLFVFCASVLLETMGNARTAVDTVSRADNDDANLRLIFQKILRAPDTITATRDGALSTPEGVRLRWSCEISPANAVDLHRVTVRVVRESNGSDTEPKEHTLYAVRPAWSDPVKREALLARRKASVAPGPGGGAP